MVWVASFTSFPKYTSNRWHSPWNPDEFLITRPYGHRGDTKYSAKGNTRARSRFSANLHTSRFCLHRIKWASGFHVCVVKKVFVKKDSKQNLILLRLLQNCYPNHNYTNKVDLNTRQRCMYNSTNKVALNRKDRQNLADDISVHALFYWNQILTICFWYAVNLVPFEFRWAQYHKV